MYTRRALLSATGMGLAILAGCTGAAPEDPGPTATATDSRAPSAPTDPETPVSRYSDSPMPDPTEAAFQSAADEFLADKATEPGTGALYLEINNEIGTTYYATDVHTNLTEAAVNVNGMLVFKTGGMNPHTFGIHDPFTTGPRACVDDVPDESTSGYDVYGFKQHGTPNSLKPYDNAQCSFEVSEDGGVYTGLGAAKAHFDTITDGYHGRLMRFKYVYRK